MKLGDDPACRHRRRPVLDWRRLACRLQHDHGGSQRAHPDQERRIRRRRVGQVHEGVQPRVEQRERQRRRPERPSSSRQATTAGSSSRFVRVRTADVEPSSGQRAHRPPRVGRHRPTPTARGRAVRPPPGAAADHLREPLAVDLDEPHGPRDHRLRAAVVHRRGRPAAGPAATPPAPARAGRPRAASRRSSGRRRRRGRPGSPGPRAAARARAGCGRGPGPRRRAARAQRPRHRASTAVSASSSAERPDHEVVEVERLRAPKGRLVRDERAGRPAPPAGRRRRRRAGPAVELEPRDRQVQPPEVGRVDARARATQDRRAIRQLDGPAGLPQDLPAERVERPDADRRRAPRPAAPGPPSAARRAPPRRAC